MFIGRPGLNKKGIRKSERLQLIRKWADRLYANTETWKGSLGTELAYLFAAIARGSHVALTRRSALVRLLRRARPGRGCNLEAYRDRGVSINFDRPQVRARSRLELVRENVFQSNLQLVENSFQL